MRLTFLIAGIRDAAGWRASAFDFFLSAGVAEVQGIRYTCRVTVLTAVLVVGLAAGALLLAGMQGA